MKPRLRHISVRLFLPLLGVMLIVFGIHTYIDIHTTSRNLTESVYSSAHRMSNLIVRSIRYSMLLNHKEDVHERIRDIGSEPGLIGINIYDKNGVIMFASDSTKIGRQVDFEAEACVICHASGKPLTAVPAKRRMRIYESPDEGHVLGLIHPIRNEPACANASCHAHSAEQTVLGVLDVKMSLASVDERVAQVRNEMAVSSLGMILIISAVLALFIHGLIERPLQQLRTGMTKIAVGDLGARIPIRSNDEVGVLAQSFNRMADDLTRARDELREWGETLEDRIAERTEALDRARAQVIHMEKMASLGTLSASVAHEINNPLFGILTYAKLILRELDTESERDAAISKVREYVSIIQNESSRCGEIVKGLLDFSRRSGGEFAVRHLNDIVDHALRLLEHHFQMQDIRVEKDLMQGGDELRCDAEQLQQAIIAPCINAVEAMPGGGDLKIKTCARGESLVMEIADNGVGIPEDSLPHVFEPFFTTKEGEAGLGLGLAVTYGIVQRHQGKIDVASTPDVGTTFTITLRREPDPRAMTDDDGPTERPGRGQGHAGADRGLSSNRPEEDKSGETT
jgi:two-component system NtrC family sensor kinase